MPTTVCCCRSDQPVLWAEFIGENRTGEILYCDQLSLGGVAYRSLVITEVGTRHYYYFNDYGESEGETFSETIDYTGIGGTQTYTYDEACTLTYSCSGSFLYKTVTINDDGAGCVETITSSDSRSQSGSGVDNSFCDNSQTVTERIERTAGTEEPEGCIEEDSVTSYTETGSGAFVAEGAAAGPWDTDTTTTVGSTVTTTKTYSQSYSQNTATVTETKTYTLTSVYSSPWTAEELRTQAISTLPEWLELDDAFAPAAYYAPFSYGATVGDSRYKLHLTYAAPMTAGFNFRATWDEIFTPADASPPTITNRSILGIMAVDETVVDKWVFLSSYYALDVPLIAGITSIAPTVAVPPVGRAWVSYPNGGRNIWLKCWPNLAEEPVDTPPTPPVDAPATEPEDAPP